MTNLTKEFVGKFVEQKKIRKVIELEIKTFSGRQKVLVEYKGGAEQDIFPLDVLRNIVSKDKYDFTELREKRIKPVVENILVILTESELSKENMEYAVNIKLAESISHSLKRANKVLWKKEAHDITLRDINDILKPKDIDKEES